jgi:hypothetical protein
VPCKKHDVVPAPRQHVLVIYIKQVAISCQTLPALLDRSAAKIKAVASRPLSRPGNSGCSAYSTRDEIGGDPLHHIAHLLGSPFGTLLAHLLPQNGAKCRDVTPVSV